MGTFKRRSRRKDKRGKYVVIIGDGGITTRYRIKHPAWWLKLWRWIKRDKSQRATITLTETIRNYDDSRS